MEEECLGEIDPLLAAMNTPSKLPRFTEVIAEEDSHESSSVGSSCRSPISRLDAGSPGSDWTPVAVSPQSTGSVALPSLDDSAEFEETNTDDAANAPNFFAPFLICVYDLDTPCQSSTSQQQDHSPFSLFPSTFEQCFTQGCNVNQFIFDESNDTQYTIPIQRPSAQYPSDDFRLDEILPKTVCAYCLVNSSLFLVPVAP